MSSFSYADMVPPSVRAHVERYQNIVADYKEVKAFMDDFLSPGPEPKKLKGLYLEAFCEGSLTILESVGEALGAVEQYIADASGSISWLHITNKLDHLPSILASLKASIEMIQSGKYHGCKIFDLCEKFINCGLPPIRRLFIIIQRFCLKKFYMQTKFWLMQGILRDPFDEFIIKSTKYSTMPQGTLSETAPDQHIRTSLSTTNYSVSTTMSLLPRVPSFFSETSKIGATNSTLSQSSGPESLIYEISSDNLPFLIPFSVAVKMLFIGEALILCQKNRVNPSNNNPLEDFGISEETFLSQFNGIENSEQFSLGNFDTLINDLWIKINKRILVLSEEVGNLSSELVKMSDIYLLGRGDLFQEFLLKASHYLSADVKTVSSRNLNTALRDAFYNVYLTDISDLFDNFYFDLPYRKSLPKSSFKTISVMSLQYNVKWPLQYLFTPDVIQTYNKLFRFLLSLKKAQMALTSVCKRANSIDDHLLRMEFIEVKMHLLSIVVNLQTYCLTTVVTHEMNVLLKAIKNTDMFTDLQKHFSSFLCNVSNRLFISNVSSNDRADREMDGISKKVNICFKNIIRLCDRFSEIFSNEIEEEAIVKLNDIKSELFEVLKVLFSLLKKMDPRYWFDDRESAGHLYNLVMCLDYNRFYQNKFQINFDD